ncbi:NAD-dependent epimerase/dehydratase family protein [Candidatus Obscuribacterales bacterium]|nr:NAD-dependent epimerase/dehydratase family protein [Candidatus Obscuribacterales bacterium]MBX3148518.1 NAD-dependent epimerase/dehydratase family protein [Candidatus Obscuribacterales bacterium]
MYEISNLTSEKIIKVYNDVHEVRSVLLRLSNIYGPRSQMKRSRFGVANWFVRAPPPPSKTELLKPSSLSVTFFQRFGDRGSLHSAH